ncbi:MAG: hypothetical protein LBB82_01750 [Treponema sp.]|nr:hypothetical protein [Treponema sp.]
MQAELQTGNAAPEEPLAEAPQTQNGSAEAVRVLEDYFHRIGEGDMDGLKTLATAEGLEAADLFFMFPPDEEENQYLKNYKAEIVEEAVEANRITYFINMYNYRTPHTVELINDGGWKVSGYWGYRKGLFGPK